VARICRSHSSAWKTRTDKAGVQFPDSESVTLLLLSLLAWSWKIDAGWRYLVFTFFAGWAVWTMFRFLRATKGRSTEGEAGVERERFSRDDWVCGWKDFGELVVIPKPADTVMITRSGRVTGHGRHQRRGQTACQLQDPGWLLHCTRETGSLSVCQNEMDQRRSRDGTEYEDTWFSFALTCT
jgi:hypothetical protein